jgi:glycosyltransferase involved in cell wall biosynthesis
MACEVPVVATNVGGLPEVVKHGVDGYLFEPRDVHAGAKHALEILTRPDRGQLMGQMARASARAKYCSNDIIPLYEAYYERILNSATSSARR